MEQADKKTYLKLGFLIFVAILAVFIFIKQYGGSNSIVQVDHQEVIEDKNADVKEIDEGKLDELKNKYDKETNDNVTESTKEIQDNEKTTNIESNNNKNEEEYTIENNDVRDEFAKQFNDESLEKVEKTAIKVVDLYFNDDFSFEKWKSYTDKNQYKSIEKNKNTDLLQEFKDKEIVKQNVHLVSLTENDLVVEVEVEWSDLVEGVGSAGNQVNMFYIVFDLTSKKIQVKEVNLI